MRSSCHLFGTQATQDPISSNQSSSRLPSIRHYLPHPLYPMSSSAGLHFPGHSSGDPSPKSRQREQREIEDSRVFSSPERDVSGLAEDKDEFDGSPRRRRRLANSQTKVLLDVFVHHQKPNAQLRAELGRRLGMTPRAVQVWFQNKRAKWKRDPMLSPQAFVDQIKRQSYAYRGPICASGELQEEIGSSSDRQGDPPSSQRYTSQTTGYPASLMGPFPTPPAMTSANLMNSSSPPSNMGTMGSPSWIMSSPVPPSSSFSRKWSAHFPTLSSPTAMTPVMTPKPFPMLDAPLFTFTHPADQARQTAKALEALQANHFSTSAAPPLVPRPSQSVILPHPSSLSSNWVPLSHMAGQNRQLSTGTYGASLTNCSFNAQSPRSTKVLPTPNDNDSVMKTKSNHLIVEPSCDRAAPKYFQPVSQSKTSPSSSLSNSLSATSKEYSGHIYFSAFLKSKAKGAETAPKRSDPTEKSKDSPEICIKDSNRKDLDDCSVIFKSLVGSSDLSKCYGADVVPVEPPILPPPQRLTTPDFFSTPSPVRSAVCESPLSSSYSGHHGFGYPLPFNGDFGLSPMRTTTPSVFQNGPTTSPLSDSLHSNDSFFENFLMENAAASNAVHESDVQ